MITASKEGNELNHRTYCTERQYETFNWLGIIVNLGFCMCLGWKRGVMVDLMEYGLPSHKLGVTVMSLYATITFLLLISAFFLADALRRFKKSFNQDNRLAVNQKTMCLHITVLFVHTLFIVMLQFFTFYTFMNPAP